MKKTFLLLTLFLFVLAQSAFAGFIYGTVTWSDGSRSNGTSKVSTSWNSKCAYPSSGRYRLELGNSVNGVVITVYINGSCWGSVKVKSSGTRVNIKLKSNGDPVGYPRSCSNRVD